MDAIASPESAACHEEFGLQNSYFRPYNLMDNAEMAKLDNLKKAVGAGTYDVRAEAVAGKLIDYMLQSSNRPTLLDAGAAPSPQYTSKASSSNSVENLKPTG
jgi:Anti-sigma-28 factor, FlgM